MLKEYSEVKGLVKLPEIKSKRMETSTSDTYHLRPSSLNKIYDLQKKLFQKLEVYEDVSRKKGKKNTFNDVSFEKPKQNPLPYDKNLKSIQKYMPNLYDKLVQFNTLTKYSQTLPQNLYTPLNQNKQSQSKVSIIEQLQSPINLSQKEINQFYLQHYKQIDLPQITSSSQITKMNDDLIKCELQIKGIQSQMELIIKQIGSMYIQ